LACATESLYFVLPPTLSILAKSFSPDAILFGDIICSLPLTNPLHPAARPPSCGCGRHRFYCGLPVFMRLTSLYCRWLAAIVLHLFASCGRCNFRDLEGLLLSLFPTAVTRIWTPLRSAQRKTVLRRFLFVFSKYNLHFYLECWKLSLIVGNYKAPVCFEGCEICVLRYPRWLCVILSLVDCE
jgi:hypothetical protein